MSTKVGQRIDTIKYDYQPRAWTGGKAPTKADWISNRKLRQVTKFMFQRELVLAIQLGCTPITLDTARIYWNRAKHDAFATLGLN